MKLILILLTLFSLACQPHGGSVENSTGLAHAKEGSKKKIKAPVFEVESLEGEKISLEDYKGKIVFLDFWATWCPPCVISAPEIEKLSEEYAGKDIVILSISLDTNRAAVKRFIKRKKLKGSMAISGNSQVDLQYRVSSLPSFYLIDREGYLLSVWKGYHPSMLKTWREEFDRLLEA